MRLKITKHDIMMSLIYFMFGWMFFHRFLMDYGFPSAIRYVLDMINVLLLTFAVLWRYKPKKINTILLIIYTIIITIGSFSFLIYNQSLSNIILFVLDCRNLLRFAIFFISCNLVCSEKDIRNMFKFILLFHVINIPCVIYHYFTVVTDELVTRGDLLNGFFGTARGGNTYLNVLFITVIVISYEFWKKKEISLRLFVFFFVSCMLLSALIELKIFFIEIIMIIVLNLDFSPKRITLKKLRNSIIAITAFVLIMYITIQILYKMYPVFANIFTIEKLLASAFNEKGYSGAGDFNRLTAVLSSFETFFNYDIIKGLFGIGIGTTSDVGGLSEFAQKYEYTHYSWFSSSYVFTQVGFIGLTLYISTFIFMLKLRNKKSPFSNISKVSALMGIFLLIYGEALKTDIAYLLYFIIATGYVKRDSEVENYEKKFFNHSTRV